MIGILGGTFDPIHHGHLRTALDAQQQLGLEQIRLIPLRDPPHRDRPGTPAARRLEMVRAAAAQESHFVVDDQELRREGKSYTVDTLRSLRADLGTDQTFCLLMGRDAFRGFPDWHQPDEILKLAHLLVMERPGEQLPDLYPERTLSDPAQLLESPTGAILPVTVTQLEISSTGIRQLIGAGRSPRYLLPDPVLEIIERHRLYR